MVIKELKELHRRVLADPPGSFAVCTLNPNFAIEK
jgi:hypothetical protein